MGQNSKNSADVVNGPTVNDISFFDFGIKQSIIRYLDISVLKTVIDPEKLIIGIANLQSLNSQT